MIWRIYYPAEVVGGSTPEDWRAAPDSGVQVIVLMERPEDLRWHSSRGAVRDRRLWTGTDEYDPFGYGVKTGSALADAEYLAIWERACGDD